MMENEHKGIKGFTLMELMITITLIGIIASFGIPTYRKSIWKARERNAILYLKTIHGANEIYRARNAVYAPGANLDLGEINTALSISLVDNPNITFDYSRQTTTTWTTVATVTGAGPVIINENTVDEANNPCCNTAGTCLIVPNC